MSNLKNRLVKLENASPKNLAGIIVYMENVTNKSITDENGNSKEVMVSGDFRLNNEDNEVLSLEEMQEHINGSEYKYITFLPVRDKLEDIEWVEVSRSS